MIIYRLLREICNRCCRWFWTAKVRLTAKEVRGPIWIGGPTSVSRQTTLGNFSSLNGVVVKGVGPCEIGDYVHTGTDVLIITSNHNHKSTRQLPYDDVEIPKKVSIGRACWLGDRVTILPGVVIGEGAIIQAGAVVVSDIPRLGIAGGNPAEVFRFRDEKSYDALARDKMFSRW